MASFKQRIVIAIILAFTASTALAQYYSGEHTFDGEHEHEASASVTVGKNIITGHRQEGRIFRDGARGSAQQGDEQR